MNGCCAAKDCGRRAESRGWCRMHYMRWYRTGGVHLVADQPWAPPFPMPVRAETDDYCPCCGMNPGHHWTGCPEAVAA